MAGSISNGQEPRAVADSATSRHLSQIVIRGLRAGRIVEIEGLGTFYPDAVHGLRFEPKALPQVFIAYVKEDEALAARLYSDLQNAGFSPWMDVRKLLPGQNWPRAIQTAIEDSDFFIACFSGNSVRKKGGFQAEIRYALDCARQIPLDEIFVVPVRLDACEVPRSIRYEIQYIDLFPDREAGFRRLTGMMRREIEQRRAAQSRKQA
jgi:TIR domain